MDLSYVLTALITFAALFCGLALAFIARAEIKPAKRYFRLAQHLLFLGISGLSMFLEPSLAAAALGLTLIYLLTIKKNNHDVLSYLLLALFLWQSTAIIIPALIFLYGLVQGTLTVEPIKKIPQATMVLCKRYIWYLLLVLGLGLL